MSRAKNAARNGIYALTYFMIKSLVAFAVRTILIKYLGEEYLGINGLVSNILSFLSLAELGVGNAVAVALYKPIAEGDTQKAKSIVGLYRKITLGIALFVFVVGLVIMPLLPHLIEGGTPSDVSIYIVFLIFLVSSVTSYFAAPSEILFLVHQRNDIESKISLVFLFVSNGAQVIAVVLTQNYYVYLLSALAVTLLNRAAIYFVSKKHFPDLRGKAQPLPQEDRNGILTYTGAMFIHKIGGVVVFSIDNIIISAFLGLAVLGLYSNYTFVMLMVASLTGLLVTSFRGSVGNLIAEKPPEETHKIFSSILFVMLWVAGFCVISLITMFQPFIALWLGESYQIDFATIFFLCISFYLSTVRSACLMFIDCAGLNKKALYKPIIEAVLNLGLSILLVKEIGLAGVLLATVISTITVCFWIEPRVLYRNYFKGQKLRNYFFKVALFALLTAVIGGLTYFAASFIPQGGTRTLEGVLSFAAIGGVCLILPNLFFFAVFRRTEEFGYLTSTLKRVLGKRK